MIHRPFFGFFHYLNNFLHRPFSVLLFCLGIAFISLIIEGSLFQLWSLHRDYSHLLEKKSTVEQMGEQLTMKIEKATDPSFVEREVRDRFDLVGEGDLVFVFTDEGM